MRALAKACRDLQHVYLAGCSRITDQGLRALGSLRKLQVLNIADCTRWGLALIRQAVVWMVWADLVWHILPSGYQMQASGTLWRMLLAHSLESSTSLTV